MGRDGYIPYHTLEKGSEDLVPGRYPNNHPPFDLEPLPPGIREAFVLSGGRGCGANVGGDALEVRLLETEVEPK